MFPLIVYILVKGVLFSLIQGLCLFEMKHMG